MRFCAIDRVGSSSSAGSEKIAKKKWVEDNIAYVDKDFNLGNPAGSNTQYSENMICSMDDVLPSGKTLIFAVMLGHPLSSVGMASHSQRGGYTQIESVTGRNTIVRVGYSYSGNIEFTLRGFYFKATGANFEINSITHDFNIGNPIGSNTVNRVDIECTMDTVLPEDAVIVGYGYKKLGNRTGWGYLNTIINRTPIINVGYSYNQTVFFTLIAYYI